MFRMTKPGHAPNLYKLSHVGVEKMEAINAHDQMIKDIALAEKKRGDRRSNQLSLLGQELNFFKMRLTKLQTWTQEEEIESSAIDKAIKESKRAIRNYEKLLNHLDRKRKRSSSRQDRHESSKRVRIEDDQSVIFNADSLLKDLSPRHAGTSPALSPISPAIQPGSESSEEELFGWLKKQ